MTCRACSSVTCLALHTIEPMYTVDAIRCARDNVVEPSDGWAEEVPYNACETSRPRKRSV